MWYLEIQKGNKSCTATLDINLIISKIYKGHYESMKRRSTLEKYAKYLNTLFTKKDIQLVNINHEKW